VSSGSFTLKITKHTPRVFYYNSSHDFAMGGLCLVFDH
jgi:hypothetical protein